VVVVVVVVVIVKIRVAINIALIAIGMIETISVEVIEQSQEHWFQN
jgi:hypothetical protein